LPFFILYRTALVGKFLTALKPRVFVRVDTVVFEDFLFDEIKDAPGSVQLPPLRPVPVAPVICPLEKPGQLLTVALPRLESMPLPCTGSNPLPLEFPRVTSDSLRLPLKSIIPQ
jgi:hypothetical protein